MKPAPEMPSDLDHQAAKKWAELIESCAADVDPELIANYCRSFSILLMIRREKKRLQKKGKFKTMTPARDGTMGINPLIREENRLTASLTRMLKSLGLSPSREESPANRRSPAAPAPRGMHGDEPAWGWAIEAALCGPRPEPSADEIEADRQRAANEKLLAANDWRAYEAEHDEGPGGKHGN